MSNPRVLVIDDDVSMLELARFHLLDRGYEVAVAQTGAEGLEQAAGGGYQVVLSDFSLPDMDGIELVKHIKDAAPDTEIIMVTGYGSVAKAVEATKAGAFYFVEKPVDFDELLLLIEKALERGVQTAEIRRLRDRLSSRTSYYNIIGSSKAMQNLYEMIESVAESDANILIVGESGTGKELIANAIHFRSRRSRRPFVKINCAALPKDLIESELFGHVKGAFTGAASEKAGLIGQADGGSLLLDEITEMPLELQPKLLRVLQERAYRRLGGDRVFPVDFRLITATNRDPRQAVTDGNMREDLFYRINTIELRVPPLREREEDIQHLAEHFLRTFAEKYQRNVRSISQSAYARLFSYRWPGNVRELQNAVERAVLLCRTESIEASDLQLEGEASLAAESKIPDNVASCANADAVSGVDWSLADLARRIVEGLPAPIGEMNDDIFKTLEGVLVDAALERTQGNKQAAAQLLGVYRPRLYSMIRKHNLGEAGEGEDGEDAATAEYAE